MPNGSAEIKLEGNASSAKFEYSAERQMEKHNYVISNSLSPLLREHLSVLITYSSI